jgi:glycogen debranching enzyme
VSPLTPEQRKRVVDICGERLLTPYGLRSLAPDEPAYQGRYAGGLRERDATYHQGTVWGWLLGPFALAHYRVYGDRDAALRVLDAIKDALGAYGIGTLGEIFDGDAPFSPNGCIAQAWTVAEVLRVWTQLAASSKSVTSAR